MKDFIPFALPDVGEEEINEVVESLKSGWLTTGPKTKLFEKNFSEFLGGKVNAIAVNSATAGLHLALEAAGIGPGDEVITTPYTFTSTAEVVRYLGANPIFVDIDPDTFNIDSKKIEAAIIPVHFGGLSCNMDDIIKIAKIYDLRVIEDAAHAFPTTYNKELIGTMNSDATVFSFYATKTIATGEGGMIVTRNPELAYRCQVMRLHGISRDAFDRYSSKIPSWYYEVVAPGYKYNLTDIAASLGIQQLKKAWKFQRKREEMAKIYDLEFSDLPLILPPKPSKGDVHSWHLYVIRINDFNMNRNRFIEIMAEKGIGCSVHFIPLHIHPYWRDAYNLKPEDFPAALSSYEHVVSLPIYTKMTESDQGKVIQTVKEIVHSYASKKLAISI